MSSEQERAAGQRAPRADGVDPRADDLAPLADGAAPGTDGADPRAREMSGRVAGARIGVPPEVAITAVLQTLGEVLPTGTAGYLAANLPDPVRASVGRHFPPDEHVEPVRRRDFEAVVAVRCGRTVDEADGIIRAVTGALEHAVPRGVLADVRAEAPEQLLDLLPTGRSVSA
jgi:uncharacterized protein (DUF2267 family)